MEKVRAEVGIYSLTYEDLSLQNVLDSKGQLVLEKKTICFEVSEEDYAYMHV